MKKHYGIVGIAALAALAGCSPAPPSTPPEEPTTVEVPKPETASTPDPKPEPPSEVDQYLHDVRTGTLLDFGYRDQDQYPDVPDRDLLEAGFAFCDYLDTDEFTGSYRMAHAFASVFHYPESIADAGADSDLVIATAAVENLCPDHYDALHAELAELLQESAD